MNGSITGISNILPGMPGGAGFQAEAKREAQKDTLGSLSNTFGQNSMPILPFFDPSPA